MTNASRNRPIVLSLLGPTASGKSEFAVRLAERLDGEILNLDSTSVYRAFDVGASKPGPELLARAPHHLVDALDPAEPFSAARFVELAIAAAQGVLERGRTPIFVGGTYFYLRALQHGMYPVPEVSDAFMEQLEAEFPEDAPDASVALHAAVAAVDPTTAELRHRNDRYRLLRALAIYRVSGKPASELAPEVPAATKDWLWLKYGMAVPRPRLHQRIAARTDAMIAGGLVEETRRIRTRWPDAPALKSIGYAEALRVLDGTLAPGALATEIVEKTRQLAKRQMTWLRSDPEIRFVDERDEERIVTEWTALGAALGQPRAPRPATTPVGASGATP
jgi:tRNA dimethylallyltransferase